MKSLMDICQLDGTADRVYLDDFSDVADAVPAAADPARQPLRCIINDLNLTGALLANYSGHGSIDFWAGEQYL